MLVEKIKEIAEDVFDWTFDYGRDYEQNKADYPDDGDIPFDDRKKYLLLLWKDKDYLLNNQSGIQGYTFEGEMIFAVRSRLSDPTYQYKYETHIKNLEGLAEKMFNEFTDCEGWSIKKWKEIEVENQYDTNMDGLKIRFSVSYAI